MLALAILGVVGIIAGGAGDVEPGGDHIDERVEVGIVRLEFGEEVIVVGIGVMLGWHGDSDGR